MNHERDYLERTIATVRNHSPEENSWVAWANLFADEIERLWSVEEQLEALRGAVEKYLVALDETGVADDGILYEALTPTRCARCGKDPAEGFATVGDKRYCHGDLDTVPTCYMREQSSLPYVKGSNPASTPKEAA